MSSLRKNMERRVKGLPQHVVVEAILSWLKESEDLSVSELGDKLEEQEEGMVYGHWDENGNFRPMTEEEMLQETLASYAEYERTGHAIPHAAMWEWANRLGTDREIPCPK